MKFTALATFALFALSSAEMIKVPRSQKGSALDRSYRRQDTAVKTQNAAMSAADGSIVPFDAAGVHKQMTEAGL